MKNKLTEITIAYSSPSHKSSVKIKTSSTAFEVLLAHWNNELLKLQEEFKILLLNQSNHVLGVYEASRGGVSETVVDAKLIFATTLKCMASAIVLAHNHPSGNLKPSSSDLALTRKFKEAGKLLDIKALDHLIITKHGYYSFADHGQL
jgi:DNA repair protein RadC